MNTYLSPNAHPNKSGIVFPAFIGLYRDITKAIRNALRPCNTPYKRLHRVRGYKIAACAAVLFPCVYHVLRPHFKTGTEKPIGFIFRYFHNIKHTGKRLFYGGGNCLIFAPVQGIPICPFDTGFFPFFHREKLCTHKYFK